MHTSDKCKRTLLTADVKIDDRTFRLSGSGTGPIDAFVDGLAEATGTSIRVLDYHEHAIGQGAHVQAVSYLELRVGEQTVFGVGVDTDIISASLKAIQCGFQRAQALKHGTSSLQEVSTGMA